METKIYLDNAATTRISDEVLEEMLPWLREGYGNASSAYSLGRKSAAALAKSRERCAKALGCEPCEVFFTGGGTESDNWAVKSIAREAAEKGKKHIITSAFEHHAVLRCMERLKKEGFEITFLPVYENGIVRPEDVSAAIRSDTALVSVMYANNEIGTIQPVSEIGGICREKGVLFHTDAVQAAGNVPIDVKKQNIGLLSLSGHKIHGPKGAGLLYVSKKTRLSPFIDGGGQESGLRSGTENIAGIVGLAAALERADSGLAAKMEKLTPMRERVISRLLKIKGSRLNGDREKRLCGNVNVSFDSIEGETLLLRLDMKGIAVSTGSACSSGPSHVLRAIGLSEESANGSVRISMSEYTEDSEIDVLLRLLPALVAELRGYRRAAAH